MPRLFYRYVGDEEKAFIEKHNMIFSKSGQTYFTTDRYDCPDQAQQMLALRRRPSWRVGGILSERMPEMDAVVERLAGPMFGQPGGGRECATTHAVYLLGFSKL